MTEGILQNEVLFFYQLLCALKTNDVFSIALSMNYYQLSIAWTSCEKRNDLISGVSNSSLHPPQSIL